MNILQRKPVRWLDSKICCKNCYTSENEVVTINSSTLLKKTTLKIDALECSFFISTCCTLSSFMFVVIDMPSLSSLLNALS